MVEIKRFSIHSKLPLFVIVFFTIVMVNAPQGFAQALPEGNSGIASKYPGDAGIGNDSNVIFSDDFESYTATSGLTSRWSESYHNENIRIATEYGTFYSGKKAVEFQIPKTNVEVSNTLVKYISPTRDVLFVRYYAKLDSGFNILGSSHNGCTISSSYWDGPGSGPGIKADGYNKFMTSYEAGRFDSSIPNPGQLNLYIYHPEQRDIWGDHFFPNGEIMPWTYLKGDFGPNFVSRPQIVPALGKWYSYELMVKANTPGQRDGRIAMWLDGKIIADFMNLRLRDTTDLKIDRMSVDLHVNGTTQNVTKRWIDNVVVSTSYIGPMYTGSVAPTTLAKPKNLRAK